MGFYHRHVFPRLLDLVMGSPVLRTPRCRTLAPAGGRILEVGFGTGRNLAHYPASVHRIEAIDPDFDLDRLAARRIAASDIEVEFHHLDAEHLPFDTASFDTVVSTFTLCSIPDVVHALAEIRRVLRPGGRFLFLEHGQAPDASVARLQSRLTPWWKPLAGGCHLDRPIARLVTESGLHPASMRTYYMERTPRFLGYLTEGAATRE